MQRLFYVTTFICLSFSLSMHAASNTLVAQQAIGEQSLLRYLHGKIYGAFGSFLASGLPVNYKALIQKNPSTTMGIVSDEWDMLTDAERDLLIELDEVTTIFDRQPATPSAESAEGEITKWDVVLEDVDELTLLAIAISIPMEGFSEGEIMHTQGIEDLLEANKQQAQQLQAAIVLLEGHRQLFVDYSIAAYAGEDLVQAKQEFTEGYAELLASPNSIVSEQDRTEIEAVLALEDYRGGIATEAELGAVELPQHPLRALTLELLRQD